MSKFEVGQRVRAVGNSQIGEKVDGQCGEVCGIHGPRWVQVRFESGRDFTMHVRNLNRLVPKKPCPPQAERRQVWLGLFGFCIQYFQTEADCDAKIGTATKVHLVELKPGEQIITKEALAKAWDESINSFGPGKLSGPVLPSHRSCIFPDLAKRLGLEGSAK